ncbi:MAG: acyl-CoA dehydrogenase family protein [Candidatus Binataceae bacterium]
MIDLAWNEAQEMLRQSARGFLAKEAPKSVIRQIETDPLGYSTSLWRQMADLGWLGMPFPESAGGVGGSLIDAGLLAEELGRAALPCPYIHTAAAGLTLLEAGRTDLVARIISGDLVVVPAFTEADPRPIPEAIKLAIAPADGGAYRLTGLKRFIEYGHAAHLLLCSGRIGAGVGEHGVTLMLVPGDAAGLKRRCLDTTGGDPAAELSFEGVVTDGGNLVGRLDNGWMVASRTLNRLLALRSAEMAGGTRQVLEMTVEYTKMRVQFGHPLASFQAVQHLCADIATMADGAELVARQAIWTMDRGAPAGYEVSVAKAFAAQAYRAATVNAVQLHGGIGYMQEYHLQFYYRRARAEEVLLGTTEDHLEQVAASLGL